MILAAKLPGTFAVGSAAQRALRLCTVKAGLSGRPGVWYGRTHPAGVERLEKPRLGDFPAPWLTALTAVPLCSPVSTETYGNDTGRRHTYTFSGRRHDNGGSLRLYQEGDALG
jgi:hypothetical protein